MSLLDDYKLLELNTNATEQEAKVAYRHLAGLYHPDKNPEQDTTEHFQSLQTAYQNVLAAIRQGVVIQDWQKYDFTSANNSHSGTDFGSASDEIQRQYIKERQQAYEEMKRNNQTQERARDAALRRARSSINEKKAKEMYEQAMKSSRFKSFKENTFNDDNASTEAAIDPAVFSAFEQILKDNDNLEKKAVTEANALIPIKGALRAISYLVTFALGIYTTLYWQEQTEKHTNTIKNDTEMVEFVPGLYPQFRTDINYTLNNVNLYPAPDDKSQIISIIPKFSDVFVTNNSRQGWLAVRYQDNAGWVEEKNIGFGSAAQALASQCIGTPGAAPLHGSVLGGKEILGKNRLRLINQLTTHSLLTFESYEGLAPFSIYLNARQSLALNFIPKGRYRLLLHTGAIFHNGCQQFLFNPDDKVVMDQIEFTGAEQTLTLSP